MKILNTHYEKVWWVEVWPGNIPYLNSIENLWALLKDSTYIEPITTTIDDLKIRLDKTWNFFSINLLEKLSGSFKNGIYQMITNEGRFTKY